MERVYLDFLGFLFVIKNYNGYILMMVDQFISVDGRSNSLCGY